MPEEVMFSEDTSNGKEHTLASSFFIDKSVDTWNTRISLGRCVCKNGKDRHRTQIL